MEYQRVGSMDEKTTFIAQRYGAAVDLSISAMTLRNATFVERLQAITTAGFQVMDWRIEDLASAEKDGMDEDHFVELIQKSQIRPLDVAYFREWIGRENDPEFTQQEERLFRVSDRLQSRRLKAFVFEELPHDQIVSSLSALCQRAAQHNLIVQLEFMAYTPPVNSLRSAWEIVQATNQPNASLMIDAWQWVRSADSLSALASVPAERITEIQLSDVGAEPMPDLADESRHHRYIPGKGVMDLPQFLQAFIDHGVHDVQISVEVMSDELDALSPSEAAQRVAFGTRSVLWQALQPRA